MLVEFTVGNFRSIRERQTFSMEATSLKSSPENKALDESNVVDMPGKLRLLTSAAMYGANASGKSNFTKALQFFRSFVLNSSREGQTSESIGVEPFLLCETTEHEPSHFEIVFYANERRFRYGFEADTKKVTREWLFEMGSREERLLFTREEQAIDVRPRNFREGKGLETRTRPNALFLSVNDQFNGETAGLIMKWFRRLAVISGLDDGHYGPETIRAMAEPERRAQILQFVRQLDVGIRGADVKESPINESFFDLMPDKLREVLAEQFQTRLTVETQHLKHSENGPPIGTVTFDLETHESNGTQKLFYLSGALLATLRRGSTLIVDELDARLHPLMTCAIIQLFGDKNTNPRGAQLIFTTHDTNLLSNRLFRRDQIWFAEKDDAQGTVFYSLAEYKVEGVRVRNDADLESDYVHGKFGAIPYLGNVKQAVGGVIEPTEDAADHGGKQDITPELASVGEAA